MTQTRDMAVVWSVTEDLSPHPNNPRIHSDHQLEQLYASIARFGWVCPIIVDEDLTILAGHGRWQMAVKNNISPVPTIQITGLSESEKRAYLLADNRLSENAEWDVERLLSEIDYLSGAAIEADTLGFSDADILSYQSMIDDTGFTEPVDAPSPPANVASSVASGERSAPIESSTEPTQIQRPDLHPGAEQTLVPFSLMLPVEDRERVYAVLNRVRGDDLSMAEALMLVVDAFDADAGQESESEHE